MFTWSSSNLPFWKIILMHMWLLVASPWKPKFGCMNDTQGQISSERKLHYTTLGQTFVTRISQHSWNIHLGWSCPVTTSILYVYSSAFIIDVCPSNSSASIALIGSAQTGRAPPASHGNGCPYWEPLHNAHYIKCVEDYQEFGSPSLISGIPPCTQHGVICKMYFFIFWSLIKDC